MTQDRDWVESEITTLQDILKEMPVENVIDRESIKARLKELRKELNDLTSEFVLLKKSELDSIDCHFTGKNYADKELIGFQWSAGGIGFGELWFTKQKDGTWECDNEMMSRGFVKRMLCAFVDSCSMKDEVSLSTSQESLNTFLSNNKMSYFSLKNLKDEDRAEVIDMLIEELQQMKNEKVSD